MVYLVTVIFLFVVVMETARNQVDWESATGPQLGFHFLEQLQRKPPLLTQAERDC